eukprot:724578-Pelagomonas_calceolata.AAC.1
MAYSADECYMRWCDHPSIGSRKGEVVTQEHKKAIRCVAHMRAPIDFKKVHMHTLPPLPLHPYIPTHLRSDLLMEVVGPCCRQLEDLYQVRGKLNRQVLSVQAQCIERCTFLIQHPCAHTELPIMAPFTATLLIAIFCALACAACQSVYAQYELMRYE